MDQEMRFRNSFGKLLAYLQISLEILSFVDLQIPHNPLIAAALPELHCSKGS